MCKWGGLAWLHIVQATELPELGKVSALLLVHFVDELRGARVPPQCTLLSLVYPVGGYLPRKVNSQHCADHVQLLLRKHRPGGRGIHQWSINQFIRR